jgi:hypothetical protein
LIALKIVGPSPKYAYISAVSSKELEYFLYMNMMNKILELVVFSQDLLVTQYEKP